MRRARFARFVPAGLLVGLVAAVVAPVAVIVASAIFDPRFLGLTSETWLPGVRHRLIGLDQFVYVWQTYSGNLGRSLEIAVAAVGISLLIGVPAGYAIARSSTGAARVARGFLFLPLAVPGIAIAMGWILAYPRWRQHLSALVAGHLLYAMPFLVRAVANSLSTADIPVLEEAAASAGAGPRQRFLRVILPAARSGILSGVLMVFAISWGEFNVSFLLATPETQTFPAALYLTFTQNSFPVAAAAMTIFLAVAVPALLLLARFGARELPRFGEQA